MGGDGCSAHSGVLACTHHRHCTASASAHAHTHCHCTCICICTCTHPLPQRSAVSAQCVNGGVWAVRLWMQWNAVLWWVGVTSTIMHTIMKLSYHHTSIVPCVVVVQEGIDHFPYSIHEPPPAQAQSVQTHYPQQNASLPGCVCDGGGSGSECSRE